MINPWGLPLLPQFGLPRTFVQLAERESSPSIPYCTGRSPEGYHMADFTADLTAIVTAEATHPTELSSAQRAHLGLPLESDE